jgi:hypothetical protein
MKTLSWPQLLPVMFVIFCLPLALQAQEGTAGVSLIEDASDATGAFAKWNPSFFSIGGLTQQQVEKGGGSFSSYNYVGLNYKIDHARRFSIRPVFFYNTAGFNKYNEYDTQATQMGDLHIVYSDYEILKFEEVDVSTSFKLYLPTSDYSQQTHMILKFRPETYITKKVGMYNAITYVLKPDLYIQSQTVAVDATTPRNSDGGYRFDPRKTTEIAGLEHYLEFDASLSKSFSIKPSLGFIEDWYNSSAAENLPSGHTTSAKIGLSFDFRVAKRVTLTLGLENKPKITNRKDDLAFFRPEDNSAFLMTNASL